MKKQHEKHKKGAVRKHLTPEEMERARRWVQESTLMDDATMMMAVEGDIEAATAMLKPLLPEEDFTLKEVKVQFTIPPSQADGRRVIFDALALDQNGNSFDIEVQKADKNFSVERMVYYACSLVHANALKRKDDYEKFRRVVVVFFCDGDFLNAKIPVSRIVPGLTTNDQITETYEDLMLVLIANTQSSDAHGELAKLFADMRQANPGKMNASALANALGRVKNKDMDEITLQWVIDHMSKDEYAKYKQEIAEAERRGAERTVAKLLAQGLISREAASSILEMDEAGLERLLAQYKQ